ncbi:MAG: hypothetical protein WBW44_07190, partial [Solirubrobacterales bacterium]
DGTGTAGVDGGPPAATGRGSGDTDLTAAIAAVEAGGGGNLAVSSQASAGTAILSQANDSDVEIVAIGGFSGRESEVTAEWLAGRVEQGEIRWVLAGESGGPGGSPADGRTGAETAMDAAAAVCVPADEVADLYDCSGQAEALATWSES